MNLIKNFKSILTLSRFSQFSLSRIGIVFFSLAAAGILGSLFDSVGVSMLFPMFQGGNLSESFSSVPLMGDRLNSMGLDLTKALLLMAVFLGIKAITDFLTPFLIDVFNRDYLRELRYRISEEILSRPLLEVEKMRVGEVSNRITMDAPRATTFVSSHMKFLIYLATTLTYVMALLLISVPVTLILILAGIPFLMALLKLYGKISQITRESNKVRDDNNKKIVERLSQARLVKTLGTEKQEINELKRQYGIWSQLLFIRAIFQSLGRATLPSLPFFAALFLGLVSLWALGTVEAALVVLGPMAFISFRMVTVLNMLNQAVIDIKVNQDSVDLILGQIKDVKRFQQKSKWEKLGPINNIQFQNVSLSYGATDPLQSVNMKLAKGEGLFLRGSSGAGKSTIAHLVRGVLTATSGQVLVNGVEIQKLNPEDLNAQIGYMTQEPYLFHGSIRENLIYGNEINPTDSQINEVLETCALKKFVEGLPGQLDYRLTERGTVFSGGEKQRLSLARILLKNPSVLILDEVSSNLDPETKRSILETIQRVAQNRICLIISHDINVELKNFTNVELKEGTLVKKTHVPVA